MQFIIAYQCLSLSIHLDVASSWIVVSDIYLYHLSLIIVYHNHHCLSLFMFGNPPWCRFRLDCCERCGSSCCLASLGWLTPGLCCLDSTWFDQTGSLWMKMLYGYGYTWYLVLPNYPHFWKENTGLDVRMYLLESSSAEINKSQILKFSMHWWCTKDKTACSLSPNGLYGFLCTKVKVSKNSNFKYPELTFHTSFANHMCPEAVFFVTKKNSSEFGRIAISRKRHFRSPKRKNKNTLQ